MEEKQLEQLLQRYLAGETGLAEEEQLRECFAGGRFPARFAPYAALFAVQTEREAALSEAEVEEILRDCPPPSGRWISVRSLLRYAAVWACGLFLGGAAVWLLRAPEQSLLADSTVSQVVSRSHPDTVYRERIVVERDTVYVVHQRPAPAPRRATTVPEPPKQTVPQSPAPRQSVPTRQPEAPWREPSNLASLVVR